MDRPDELVASARVTSRRETERKIPSMLVWVQRTWSSEEDGLIVKEWDEPTVSNGSSVLASTSTDLDFGFAAAGEDDEDLAYVDV